MNDFPLVSSSFSARQSVPSTALLAGYKAATPTAATTVGTRYATNSNSTSATIQRVGMMFTAEEMAKNSPICAAYLAVRANYCSSMIRYIPNTGDAVLDAMLSEYLQGEDGTGGIWAQMNATGGMQGAFLRTADIELPVRGDAGMVWVRNAMGNLRLMEFSADQLGQPWQYTMPRKVQLAFDRDKNELVEVSGSGIPLTYFCGIYLTSAGEPVAYKIYERVDAWYGNPRIYSADDVIFFKDPASFRGIRGVTKFANSLQHMDKGERLLQFGLDAAQRQSRTSMAVFNENGAPDEPSYESAIGYDGRISYREHIANDGPQVEYFYSGDKAEFMRVEAPGEELLGGVEKSDERVCIALGMTYSFIVSPEKVGGAPQRLDINKCTKELERIKQTIHLPALNRIKRVTIDDAIERGIFRGKKIANIHRGYFQFPTSPTVDAFYDAKENIQRLRSGLVDPTRLCAEQNLTFANVARAKADAAVLVQIETQEANKRLEQMGYEPLVQSSDIQQLTDNPTDQNAIKLKAELEPEPVAPVKAALSAYIGDVRIGDLPDDVRREIARHIGSESSDLMTVKYGMTSGELIAKADPHNLDAARNHLRNIPNYECANAVYGDDEKHVLMMNDRIIDGHHYLAKAEKGKVTKSLRVIDLTPARMALLP